MVGCTLSLNWMERLVKVRNAVRVNLWIQSKCLFEMMYSNAVTLTVCVNLNPFLRVEITILYYL